MWYHLSLGNFLLLIWKVVLQNAFKKLGVCCDIMVPAIKISLLTSSDLLISFTDLLLKSCASAWIICQTYLLLQKNQTMVSVRSGSLPLSFLLRKKIEDILLESIKGNPRPKTHHCFYGIILMILQRKSFV